MKRARGREVRERNPKMSTERCRRCVLLESLWRGRKGRKGGGREGKRERGGRGWMLFRTAKLNYQIKQQRRYINKIDFARRSLSLSSKGKSPSFRV